MRLSRFLAPWDGDFSAGKPVLYHVISRVVDRRFVLGDEEREHFKMLMRMMENFSGCRVLSYCIMSNHFHLLLEVPPRETEMVEGLDDTGEDGEVTQVERFCEIEDEVFFGRLDALYSRAFVGEVKLVLERAREKVDSLKREVDEGTLGKEILWKAEEELREVKE